VTTASQLRHEHQRQHWTVDRLKIDTNAAAYTIDIYRLGWYPGNAPQDAQRQPIRRAAAAPAHPCFTTPGRRRDVTAASGRSRRPGPSGQRGFPGVRGDLTRGPTTATRARSRSWCGRRRPSMSCSRHPTHLQAYNMYGGADFLSRSEQRPAYDQLQRPFRPR